MTVKSFIILKRHTSSKSGHYLRRREQTSPESALKLRYINIGIIIVNTRLIPKGLLPGLSHARGEYPQPSYPSYYYWVNPRIADAGLRVRSLNVTSGTEVLSTHPKDGPVLVETTYRTISPSSAPAGLLLMLPD